MKPEAFLRGAMLITSAGIISRALGALYRPIVTHLFARHDGHNGELGIGLTNVPASIYLVVLAITSVGVNIAISRLVAERAGVGDWRGVLRVFRLSLLLMAAAGSILSTGFFLAGASLARLAGYPEATPGFYAMAPAMLVVSLMCTFRGLFQGLQQMGPTAVSQVLEQLTRIGTGIILVAALAPVAVNLGAAGFNFGAVPSATAALLYLLWRFFRGPYAELKQLAAEAPAGNEAPAGEIWRRLLVLAAPISLLGSVVPLVLMTDALLVKARLARAGVVGDAATALFGQLGNATSFVNLPMILAAAFFVALVPAITEAVTLGRTDVARERTATALRVTMIVALPAAVAFFVASGQIYGLIFPSEAGGAVLRALAWATLFLMLQQTAAGVLQGMGQVWLPARNFLIGLVLKAFFTWSWTAEPELAVRGAAYATVAGFAVAALLNLWAVSKTLGNVYVLPDMLWKPGAASLVMGAALWWTGSRAGAWIRSEHLAGALTLLAGGFVYAAALPLFGGLRLTDLERIGGPGRRLAAWLRRLMG
jgi:stage V sporulation protein B